MFGSPCVSASAENALEREIPRNWISVIGSASNGVCGPRPPFQPTSETLFSTVKLPGREADHSDLSSTKDNMESYIST